MRRDGRHTRGEPLHVRRRLRHVLREPLHTRRRPRGRAGRPAHALGRPPHAEDVPASVEEVSETGVEPAKNPRGVTAKSPVVGAGSDAQEARPRARSGASRASCEGRSTLPVNGCVSQDLNLGTPTGQRPQRCAFDHAGRLTQRPEKNRGVYKTFSRRQAHDVHADDRIVADVRLHAFAVRELGTAKQGPEGAA